MLQSFMLEKRNGDNVIVSKIVESLCDTGRKMGFISFVCTHRWGKGVNICIWGKGVGWLYLRVILKFEK